MLSRSGRIYYYAEILTLYAKQSYRNVIILYGFDFLTFNAECSSTIFPLMTVFLILELIVIRSLSSFVIYSAITHLINGKTTSNYFFLSR